MTMDKSTFGSAPAALYLVELLKQRNDQTLTRKVSRTLTAGRELVNDLVNAHLSGELPLRSFGRLLTLVSEKNQTTTVEAIANIDPFIAHLVTNVLEGEVKMWKRKAQEMARKRSATARNTPRGEAPPPLNAVHGSDDKTVEVLQRRSKAYLARKGKPDTLY